MDNVFVLYKRHPIPGSTWTDQLVAVFTEMDAALAVAGNDQDVFVARLDPTEV